MEQVRNSDIEYDVVWVSDITPNEEDRKTHSGLYDKKHDRIEVCSKAHAHHCVVIKKTDPLILEMKQYIENMEKSLNEWHGVNEKMPDIYYKVLERVVDE